MNNHGVSTSILLTATLALAACGAGGGGGEIAITSIPPPPPVPGPPPTGAATITVYPSPATRAGTYDTIALIDRGGALPGPSTDRLAAPGEIRITTYQPTSTANELSYTLEFATAQLPGGQSTLTALFPARVVDTPIGSVTERFGDQFTLTVGTVTSGGSRLQDYSPVASTDLGGGRTFDSQFNYSTGLSYVSLGQWNWWITDKATGNAEEYNSVYFVNGDRTPAAALPTSGTATYTASSLGFSTDVDNRGYGDGGPVAISLTADFGQRSMFAQLNRDASSNGDAIGGFITVLALDVHGTGPINSSAGFDIPLAGFVGANTPVTGMLNGAFFGPNAEQVGGVFSIEQTPGVPVVRDAFVGTKP